jgi:Phage tail assembly chaperone proteins, E, or 41 or 14
VADEAKNYDARKTADIDLDFPVEVDAIPYITLTMRRPKTKDSLKNAKFKGSDVERGIALLADLCDVAPNVIAELDDIDAQKLGKQLDAFRGGQSS